MNLAIGELALINIFKKLILVLNFVLIYQKMKLNALTYQVNNFLRYNRNINRNHRVNATLGVTYDVRDVESSVYAVQDFVTAQLGTEQPFLGQLISSPLLLRAADQQLFSVIGSINYTFKNKCCSEPDCVTRQKMRKSNMGFEKLKLSFCI